MRTVRIVFLGHPLLITGITDGNQFDIDCIDYLGDDMTDFILSLADAKTSDLIMELAAIASVEHDNDLLTSKR